MLRIVTVILVLIWHVDRLLALLMAHGRWSILPLHIAHVRRHCLLLKAVRYRLIRSGTIVLASRASLSMLSITLHGATPAARFVLAVAAGGRIVHRVNLLMAHVVDVGRCHVRRRLLCHPLHLVGRTIRIELLLSLVWLVFIDGVGLAVRTIVLLWCALSLHIFLAHFY